tara:strand:- start:635 stop:1243 length:609 start_codon:yes stop_codon:yes gene_type:complete
MLNFFSFLNLVFFILIFTSKFSSSNPINEINIKNDDGSYNFFVEIPAGTKEKWEVNKRNGLLELEEKKGRKRVIKFLAYPGNYGFIPQTYGADGDPVDVVDMDESIERGSIKKIKIVGGLYFEDKKTVDIKFLGLDPKGVFKNIETIQDLLLNKFASIEILKIWFESYKKSGKMIFFRFIDRDESIEIIQESHERWKLLKKK